MTLDQVPHSSEATIKELIGDPVLVARLRELGFVRGQSVRLVGRAPFGEPLLIELRGAVIALRKGEAQCVQL